MSASPCLASRSAISASSSRRRSRPALAPCSCARSRDLAGLVVTGAGAGGDLGLQALDLGGETILRRHRLGQGDVHRLALRGGRLGLGAQLGDLALERLAALLLLREAVARRGQ